MAPIWGKIADNKGKKRMALRAGFAIAVSYILIGMVSNEYELLLGRAFVGFANGFYPAAMTMVSLSEMCIRDRYKDNMAYFLFFQVPVKASEADFYRDHVVPLKDIDPSRTDSVSYTHLDVYKRQS